MERKYGQRGYQDDRQGDRSEGGAAAKSPRPAKDGPRSPNMTAFQGVLRCAQCGTTVELLSSVELDSTCTKCNADLRTCRNCVSFDPAARWECRAEITTRVAGKAARTACPSFAARRRIEKKTGESSRPSASGDAKAAFDRLFRK